MVDAPSVAVVMLPGLSEDACAAAVEAALAARGYARRDTVPPSGYPLAQHEWIGTWIGVASDMAIVVPRDVGDVFALAGWLSAYDDTRWLGSYRRFRGVAPVLKLFRGGVPRFRDGEDQDLEVGWPVPTSRPTDVPAPSEVGLPPGAADVHSALGAQLAPFRALSTRGTGRTLGFIRRDSPLAP